MRERARRILRAAELGVEPNVRDATTAVTTGEEDAAESSDASVAPTGTVDVATAQSVTSGSPPLAALICDRPAQHKAVAAADQPVSNGAPLQYTHTPLTATPSVLLHARSWRHIFLGWAA